MLCRLPIRILLPQGPASSKRRLWACENRCTFCVKFGSKWLKPEIVSRDNAGRQHHSSCICPDLPLLLPYPLTPLILSVVRYMSFAISLPLLHDTTTGLRWPPPRCPSTYSSRSAVVQRGAFSPLRVAPLPAAVSPSPTGSWGWQTWRYAPPRHMMEVPRTTLWAPRRAICYTGVRLWKNREDKGSNTDLFA